MRYHEWNKARYIQKRKRYLWQHSFYAIEDAEKYAYATEAELDGVDDMLVAANQSVERLLEARLKKLQEEVVDGDEVARLTRQIERARREVVMMKYNLRLAKRELKKALRNYKRAVVRAGTRGKALVKADNITVSAFETVMAAAYEHHGLREGTFRLVQSTTNHPHRVWSIRFLAIFNSPHSLLCYGACGGNHFRSVIM